MTSRLMGFTKPDIGTIANYLSAKKNGFIFPVYERANVSAYNQMSILTCGDIAKDLRMANAG